MKTPYDQPSSRVRFRSAVYIEKEEHVLLVYDPVYRGGCWILPGGEVEFDETITEAAEREVLEETGLNIKVHSMWRFREIWEQDPDDLTQFRKTLEFIFIGDFISGEIDIQNNPSKKSDGRLRIEECRWIALNELGPNIHGKPIYPSEIFREQGPVHITGISLQNLMLPKLDLR